MGCQASSQKFLGTSGELGVEVVEKSPPDVDDEPCLGLAEQLCVGVRHARLVPDRQEGIEDAGAGIKDRLDVLSTRPEVGELGMFRSSFRRSATMVCRSP